MLIQKELEEKLLTIYRAALTAAGITNVTVSGAWETAQSGLVKWVEGDGTSAAFVNVAVGNPGWQTFSTPVVSFNVNTSLFVRTELDPTGELLAAIAEVIENLHRSWQVATYQSGFTALDLENLSVDGIALGVGASPTVDGANCVVTWPFTLNGSYRESASNNN